MYRRSVLAALALTLTLAVLPACGSSSKKSSPPCPPEGSTRAAVNGAVTVCARDISFDVKTITAPAGPLSVTLINKGSQAHTFKVDGTDFELKTPSGDDVKTGTVTLTPGSH